MMTRFSSFVQALPRAVKMAAGCNERFSRTFTLKDGRNVDVRSSTEEDLEDMSRIAYEAFFRFNTSKGLKVSTPPREERDVWKGLFSMHLHNGSPMLVAFDDSGVCLGSVVCDTRGEQCCGIGPVTVEPAHQGRGIGRSLMSAIMGHVKDAHAKPLTFRLCQVAANAASFCLYASMGFNACGNLLEFHGFPSLPKCNGHAPDHDKSQSSTVEIRRATVDDVPACNVLFQEAHGGCLGRRNEIHDAVIHGQEIHGWHVYVLTDSKDGSIVAYTTGLHLFGHTVAKNEAVFKLFLEMSVEVVESERKQCRIHIDPVRYPDLVRWMLTTGMQVEKQHTMFAMGSYTGPVAPFVYCPTMDY